MSNSINKIKAAVEYLKIVGLSKYIAGFLAVIFATLYLNQLDENAKLKEIISGVKDSQIINLDSIVIDNLDKRNILITDVIAQTKKIDSLLNTYRQANNDTISIDSALNLIKNL